MSPSDNDPIEIDSSDTGCGAGEVDPSALKPSTVDPSSLTLRLEEEILYAELSSSTDQDTDSLHNFTSTSGVDELIKQENYHEFLYEEPRSSKIRPGL